MWTTAFKHDVNGVAEITHDFGNGITVVTNPVKRTIRRYHGKIMVHEEYMDDVLRQLDKYLMYLENIESEIVKREELVVVDRKEL